MSSLFEKIGGRGAVQAAVEIFYKKILGDPALISFFDGVDMISQRRKQYLFLTYAFGGPNNYSGKDLNEGHIHLVKQGLDDFHFDRVCEHLVSTLMELKVPSGLIEEVKMIAESTRNDVLNKVPEQI